MTYPTAQPYDQLSLNLNEQNSPSSQQATEKKSEPGIRTHSKKMAREKRRTSFNGLQGKDPWTEQEEFEMLLAHKQYKNKWSEITQHLKGKSNNTVKNRFYSIFRRIKGKVQRNDFSFESKLELFKICYMTSLMNYHLDHPMVSSKAKGRRGKDFIYSLIHNLPKEKVQRYEERIKDLAGHKGSMNELIAELTKACKSLTGNVSVSQYTPTIASITIKTKPKDIHAENLTPPEESNTFNHIRPYEFLEDSFILESLDNSLFCDSDSSSPEILHSPSALSEGPAAAAAGASRAACFTDTLDAWSDLGFVERSLEERTSSSIF